jgi:hypothetical protein
MDRFLSGEPPPESERTECPEEIRLPEAKVGEMAMAVSGLSRQVAILARMELRAGKSIADVETSDDGPSLRVGGVFERVDGRGRLKLI